MTYHSIFIPDADIYRLAGPEVLKELSARESGKKNLLVLPSPIARRIDPESRLSGNSFFDGGSDFLDEYKRLMPNKLSQAELNEGRDTSAVSDPKNLEGIAVYHANDALDIAYVRLPSPKGSDFDMAGLEKRIRNIWQAEEGRPIILTTSAGRHADYSAQDLVVQDPEFLMVREGIVNNGIITGSDALWARLQQENGSISLEAASEMLETEMLPNQFVKFAGSSGYGYARVACETQGRESRLVLLHPSEQSRKLRVGDMKCDNILGVYPRDMEQYIAMQHGLLNPDVSIIFICGMQGSGKTLLAYACAIDQVLIYDEQYRRQRGLGSAKEAFFKHIVPLRPNDPIGGKKRELGFEPGTLMEKLQGILAPFSQAHELTVLGDDIPFEQLALHRKRSNRWGPKRDEECAKKIAGAAYLPQHEVLKIISSHQARGYSIPNSIMLVDEAQNFTPYEIKTLLSRLAEGSVAIICGDTKQIDNPDCNRDINGLTGAIRHYMGERYAMFLALPKNYRSPISIHASKWRVYSK